PRRGTPVRDHLPPAASRRRCARVDVRPDRGRRPGAAPGAAPALRLRRARARRDRGGARGRARRRCEGRAADLLAAAQGGSRVAAAVGPAAAWRVIRSRNFGPYFAGNAASASGTWFQNLAASIFVYRATHSPFLLGVLNFCQFAPVLALSPWAGAFADRHDRRRLLLVTQVASVLLSGGLAVLGWAGLARVWNVIACSAGLGVASAFAVPSQQSLIAALVQPDDVPQAVALNSMTFNLARAIGPASAAGVIAGLGIPWAFALNSGSYLALVAGLLAVRPREEERAERPSLRESFALLRADRRLTIALLVVMTAGFG